MNPAPPRNEPVAGNVYDKYATRNPFARALMRGFDRSMLELLARTRDVKSVLEVGCGEGHVTEKLAEFFPHASVMGSDLSPDIVALARILHPGMRFETRSVYDLGASGESYDLIVASEVLEHLEEPELALASLVQASRAYLFVSVPHEPLWRLLNLARGKYLLAGGNTPGHVQHFSRSAIRSLLTTHAEIMDLRSPIPWTQVLCRVRRNPPPV